MRRISILCPTLLIVAISLPSLAQEKDPRAARPTIPTSILLRIIRAEDERRWDDQLNALLGDKDPKVRARAALAAGRIGDERAVPALGAMLRRDKDDGAQQMAAFALGETESSAAADALLEYLNARQAPARARVVEALGKIAAALPKGEETRGQTIGKAILDALRYEAARRSMPDGHTILLGLTAVLRAKPGGAGPVVAGFLGYADSRIIADSLNTMARLTLKDRNEEVRQLLLKHADPVVRANAARVAGAAEDKGAFDSLLDRARRDDDLRVRVSAIRALGALKDASAAPSLLDRGEQLLAKARKMEAQPAGVPTDVNEILEIATTIGRVLPNAKDSRAVEWLQDLRSTLKLAAPEVEIALARVAPQTFQIDAESSIRPALFSNPNERPVVPAQHWRQWANVAQGFAELAVIKSGSGPLNLSIKEVGTNLLHGFLLCAPSPRPNPKFKPKAGDIVVNGSRCVALPALSVPDFLRAYAAFKPADLGELLHKKLDDKDVITRATAAELLGELPPDEATTRALVAALPAALADTDLNDAALAILDALGKQNMAIANEAIKTALGSSDHLLRRKAVALLKANGGGDFSSRIGTVQTRNTEADYRRALARIGKQVRATVETSKGSFTIEFLPEDAPLTVDNFINLARKGFFNGQTIPRVVPNFVVQAGDPRGDQNGGPGYQIRCEINTVAFTRGMVGMALSGKDTGGSQWFVTHSPQPHLDGGYTVFGRVVAGMDVVDKIARGDVIWRVTVSER
ncbi:MAG: hypothetical protein QOD75_167 [Blastocatellia bacterium]|jgi:cyclophilin family peptidyl-prolyl cis-trans isomerase/HEAT repeat protein|nr:hypothetical protein [Blastocatellia bacterium]